MSGYALVLKFDTDDPEFVRGWEMGTFFLTAKMTRGLGMTEFDHTIRTANLEMALRVAEAEDWDLTVAEYGEDVPEDAAKEWTDVRLTVRVQEEE